MTASVFVIASLNSTIQIYGENSWDVIRMEEEICDREALETINANHSLIGEMHHLRVSDCKQENLKYLAN